VIIAVLYVLVSDFNGQEAASTPGRDPLELARALRFPGAKEEAYNASERIAVLELSTRKDLDDVLDWYRKQSHVLLHSGKRSRSSILEDRSRGTSHVLLRNLVGALTNDAPPGIHSQIFLENSQHHTMLVIASSTEEDNKTQIVLVYALR
jgi:hypothetical protein